MAMRLIQTDGKAANLRSPDPALVLKSKVWWARLADGTTDVTTLAREEGVNTSWVSKVVRLNFLAPSIVSAILDGNQPVRLSPRSIVATAGVPTNWADQVNTFSAL